MLVPQGRGIKRAMQKVLEHDGPIYLHGSLPCTCWTNIQQLNIHMYGQPYIDKLNKAQRKSLRMFHNFMLLAKAVEAKNGLISFEWPPSAGGWKTRAVQKLVEWLEFYIEFHGCSVGVKATSGEKMLKPFGIATNNSHLARELEKRQCTRDHYHAPCEGKETTRSGHYTAELARILILSLKDGGSIQDR